LGRDRMWMVSETGTDECVWDDECNEDVTGVVAGGETVAALVSSGDVCVSVSVCVCARACVRACVRVCVCVSVFV
jgi:hypothetical protein